MHTAFRISGLAPELFRPLFDLSDADLVARNIIRMVADEADGYPCRVSVDHAPIGDEILLLNYEHQPAKSPYRASGPIFVCRSAAAARAIPTVVPPPIAKRLISFRAYDANNLIVDAEVAEGTSTEAVIHQLFADARVSYLHLHYARRGCYAARVDRAM